MNVIVGLAVDVVAVLVISSILFKTNSKDYVLRLFRSQTTCMKRIHPFKQWSPQLQPLYHTQALKRGHRIAQIVGIANSTAPKCTHKVDMEGAWIPHLRDRFLFEQSFHISYYTTHWEYDRPKTVCRVVGHRLTHRYNRDLPMRTLSQRTSTVAIIKAHYLNLSKGRALPSTGALSGAQPLSPPE